MNLLREKARCRPMGAAAYFGGDSDSRTENKTEVKDMRVVGGAGSSNVSADGGSSVSTTIIATDHGAVSGGLQLGGKAIDATVKQAEGLQKTLTTMFNGALGAVKDSNDAVTAMGSKVAGDLATAFTDAKAPEKNILIVGGVVVVGLAAVMLFAGKRG